MKNLVRSFIVFLRRRTQFSLTPYYRSYFGKNSGWLLLKVWNDKFGKNSKLFRYDSVNQNYYRVRRRKLQILLGFGLAQNGHKKGYL
jgi:hypothetical protein